MTRPGSAACSPSIVRAERRLAAARLADEAEHLALVPHRSTPSSARTVAARPRNCGQSHLAAACRPRHSGSRHGSVLTTSPPPSPFVCLVEPWQARARTGRPRRDRSRSSAARDPSRRTCRAPRDSAGGTGSPLGGSAGSGGAPGIARRQLARAADHRERTAAAGGCTGCCGLR